MCFKTYFHPRGVNDIEFFIIFTNFYETNCKFLNYMNNCGYIQIYVDNLENMNIKVFFNL
jgi:hypothetical protein